MEKKVVIASLLHDIGKLLQRANNQHVYHGIVGKNYLKEKGFDADILESVYNHHGKYLSKSNNFINPALTYLVYEADNISAGIDRRDNINENDEEKWDTNAALKSVFSYLNGQNVNKEYFYPARTLDPNNKIVYPLNTHIEATCDKYKELKTIIDNQLDKDITPNSLLELCETTMSYITSSTNTKENLDISLFDHSKITAAVASCLYQYFEENNITDYKEKLFTNPNRNEKYYLLVSGDISGIQDFIYTISTKGALKSLRARSFYLELMLEHIVDEILEQLNMFRCNLLYTGGGHFYMLLPNTEKTKQVLEDAQKKINDWFINEFGSSLYIAIGTTEASGNDLKNTKDIFREVSLNLSKKKQSRYSKEQLKELMMPKKNISAKECVICTTSSKTTKTHKFINDDIETCETCANLFNLGEELVKDDIKLLVRKIKTDNSLELPSLSNDKKYLSVTTKDVTEDARIYVLNNRCVGTNYATKLFAGNYIYKNEEKVANFNDFLDKNEKGINRLAVLRCDVDNLGATFISGLPDGYSTLSRTTALSRQLSLFFKFYINNICKSDISGEADKKIENFSLDGSEITNKEKKLSIVYSGGDDVFVVGYWLDVFNFAVDLKKAFKEYSCGKLHFSAGLGLFSSGYPISQMAVQAGNLEDEAKKYDNCTKDAVALFGQYDKEVTENEKNKFSHIYHWDELNEQVVSKLRDLYDWCYFNEDEKDENKILFSTSMRYKFKQLLLSNDEKGFNLARLAYTLARLEPKKKELENEILAKNWNSFRENIYKWAREESKSLLTTIDLIIYLNRKEVKHD